MARVKKGQASPPTDDDGNLLPLRQWTKAELIEELSLQLRRKFSLRIQGLTMLHVSNEEITRLLLYRTGTRHACVDLFDGKLRDIRLDVIEGGE